MLNWIKKLFRRRPKTRKHQFPDAVAEIRNWGYSHNRIGVVYTKVPEGLTVENNHCYYHISPRQPPTFLDSCELYLIIQYLGAYPHGFRVKFNGVEYAVYQKNKTKELPLVASATLSPEIKVK